MKTLRCAAGTLLSITGLFLFGVAGAQAEEAFQSASTVDEVRQQIESLPVNESWWTVNGRDMGWNNKNLNRIFPDGQRLPLRAGPRARGLAPMPEIAAFEVDTPKGRCRFADFLRQRRVDLHGHGHLHQGKVVFEDYPRMEPYERPIYWSVTKVLVSAVVSILEDRGQARDRQEHRDLHPGAWSARPTRASPSGTSSTWQRVSIARRSTTTSRPASYRLMQTTGEAHWDESSPDNPYELHRRV